MVPSYLHVDGRAGERNGVADVLEFLRLFLPRLFRDRVSVSFSAVMNGKA
jgi:hypothetical protein